MINKLIAGLFVILSLVMLPSVSSSKDNGPQTIVLTSKNLLVLNSQVDGDSVGVIITKAKQLDEALGRNKHLYLYLNSPGGSVQSGLELIEALKGLGRPVDTVTAFAASMAWQIAQNLDTRNVLKSGVLMSHRAAGQFDGSFGGTSPSQLDSRVRLWTQITKEMDETTVKRTNGKQTLESYQKAYSSELWVTGQEAVANGYADAVVSVKCDKTLDGVSVHQVQFMGMIIAYDLSNCPINTSPSNIRIGGKVGMTEEYVNNIKKLFLSQYSMHQNTPLPMVF